MTELDYANSLYEFSVKLCAAVKKYECLHVRNAYHKTVSHECEAAWEKVSLECKESVEICKNRWGTLRRCFFKGIKRRGNKYYLHEHLEFLQDQFNRKTKDTPNATLNDETSSTISRSYDDGLSLHVENGVETINIFDDEEDKNGRKSVSSKTTSADESQEIMPQNGQVFIIDEIEDDINDRRSSFKRSCKRLLDPEIIDELTGGEDEEQEGQKRYRKTITTEKRKTFPNESDQPNYTPQLLASEYKARMDKVVVDLALRKVDKKKYKVMDRFTNTDIKETREFGTQYEEKSSDFDEIFMQSIQTQLQAMNPRQKLNFKRKIYQSLLEVFDDAADFPNIKVLQPLSGRHMPPRIINSTVGELRLMRELVSLVQAAKNTPEIMNDHERVKTSTPVSTQPLTLSKVPITIPESVSKTQTSPSISLSPSPEDDDLPFFINNIDDEDNSPLPRSWDELKTKSTESAKAPNAVNVTDASKSLPRRVLQKVVRVSGAGASTVVTHDGDKKRVYRIYPKLINPNTNEKPSTLSAKNGSSVGTFYVSTSSSSKNTPDNKNEKRAGSFFVSSAKGNSDGTSSTIKINSNSSSINLRPIITSKPTTSTVEARNFNQLTSLNTGGNNATNSPIIFKNVHSSNRVLSPSTGLFRTISTTKPSSSGTITNPNSGKSLTNKPTLGSPMLPPAKRANVATVRSQPQIMQRRFSICGSLPADKVFNNSLTNVETSALKMSDNPQKNTSISQIKISQPISLNSKAINDQTSSSTPNDKPKTSAATTSPKGNIQYPLKSLQSPGKSTSTIKSDISSTVVTTKSEDIPIYQTAGTLEADVLDEQITDDPLYLKQTKIKSEPE